MARRRAARRPFTRSRPCTAGHAGVDVEDRIERNHADAIGPRLPLRAQVAHDVGMLVRDVMDLRAIVVEIVELPAIHEFARERDASAGHRCRPNIASPPGAIAGASTGRGARRRCRCAPSTASRRGRPGPCNAGMRLRPSQGMTSRPSWRAGYPADAASRIVGSTSTSWNGARTTLPLRSLPCGQCTISGVAIPPSCVHCL
jgi:hypothetical protein